MYKIADMKKYYYNINIESSQLVHRTLKAKSVLLSTCRMSNQFQKLSIYNINTNTYIYTHEYVRTACRCVTRLIFSALIKNEIRKNK